VSMPEREEGTVLLTGATGFVGMSVLARLLERSRRRVVAIVRAGDYSEAGSRLAKVLLQVFGARASEFQTRVAAIPGDVTLPWLGQGERGHEWLAGQVDEVLHCAASVAFTLPAPEARAINVAGTARVQRLARRAADLGGLRRFVHVSTAYVAGTHEGEFREEDLDVGQDFRNSYEQSKHEAEHLLHERAEGVPTVIARPSIVVGERDTGWTSAFNVLYWPLRAYSRGLYEVVPAAPAGRVDVVPVDYVADGLVALLDRPASGAPVETFHLTAGDRAATIAELMDLATAYFDREPPQVVAPGELEQALEERELSPQQEAVIEGSAPYFPYLTIQSRFDDRRARRALDPAGLRPPAIGEYFRRLMDFATAAGWGKRPIDRPAAARAATRPAARAAT
jgi:thioester reductase-like protein